jgi:diguanylate cyclase (GGDEF)-like protein
MGDAGLALAAGLAAVACGVRAFLLIRHYRAACFRCYSWILAGLSCLAAAVGNGVWAWYELVWNTTPPQASAADWSFLFFGPLALAALLAAHGDQVGALARVRLLLDTVLVAGSLFVVAWAVALAISVARVQSPVRTFLVLGYPAFDLMLVSLLLALRGRPARERGGIGTGVRIGYLVIVCCDSIFTLPSVHATYQSGGPLDTGWFAGYLVIAAAATTGDGAGAVGAAVAGPDSPLRRRLRIVRVIAPYAAAGFCLTGVLADGLDRRSDPVVLFAGAAVLVALVARQAITLLENQRLTTELRGAAESLRHHAYHDPLTGLANRALLTDRLEHALAQRAAEWEPVAVMFLDLDGFKAVNDSAGHETGDRVLVEAARRMGRTLRAGDTIARFGGDEFVVVLQTGTRPEGALRSAHRLLAALGAEYAVDGRVLRTGASIGLAFAEPGGSAADLLRRADAAMYTAKGAGKGRVHCEPLSADWPIPHGETTPIIA